ncbi:MAG: Flp pilus assembly protein CpaB [Bdellovibrionales bacterium]|nr:Flp pilus assembly protein CpaB [Bdellovibrionales bacterium]
MAVRTYSKKNRRKKRDKNLAGITLFSVSLIVAAVIISNGRQRESSEDPRARMVEKQTTTSVPLPVPKKFVPAGTKFDDIQFTTTDFPENQIPSGALLSLEPLRGTVTLAPLPAKLPVFAENFSRKQRGNPVIERIPEGMRAITVRVDATTSVEGWATSGAIVDVLLIQDKRTNVIAERVKILSAERSVEPASERGAPSVPSTVTLLVSQEQCLAINTAIPLGKIAFALRGYGDEHGWSDGSFTAKQLESVNATDIPRSKISGFVRIKEDGSETQYALSDGRWLPASETPEGFFFAEK